MIDDSKSIICFRVRRQFFNSDDIEESDYSFICHIQLQSIKNQNIKSYYHEQLLSKISSSYYAILYCV